MLMRWITTLAIFATLAGPAVDNDLAWAINQYEAAGISVPAVTVIEGGCEGITRGRYYYGNGDDDVIRLCVSELDSRRQTLLHELAHHMDRHYLTDTDRDELMAAWGVTVWRGAEVTWSDRGAERFADALAWVVGPYDSRRSKPHLPESEWKITRINLTAADMLLAYNAVTKGGP